MTRSVSLRSHRGMHRRMKIFALCAALAGVALLATSLLWTRLYGAGDYADIVTATDTDRGDGFGSSVAITEDWIAVGAFRDSDVARHAGAVYVSPRSGKEAQPFRKLAASNPAPGDQSGFSVAMEGTSLAVGSVGEFGKHALESRTEGHVEVYTLTSNGWTTSVTLRHPEAAPNDRFGFSLAISDGWLAVGARGVSDDSGEVLLYRIADLAAAGLNRQVNGQAIEPSQILTPEYRDPGSRFGESVALSGRVLVVGAPGSSFEGAHENAGSAAVFELTRDDGNWRPVAQVLRATVPEAGARFGTGVATDGTNILVGASHWSAGDREGSVWLIEPDTRSGGWSPPVQLPVPDTRTGDMDGFRVAIDGKVAVASAHLSDLHGDDSGSVVVFSKTSAGWKYSERLIPADGDEDDHYGIALALDADSLLIGAEMADARGRKSGGIYLDTLQ